MTDIDKTIDEAFSSSLPFESWDKLNGETALNFAAFCAYRDFGAERSVRKAVENYEKDKSKWEKRYRVWRYWATQFRWKERAADYDRYQDKIKQTENRKSIEAQTKKQIEATNKLLDKAIMKLDIMNAEDLTQNGVIEFTNTAIKWQREISGLASASTETKQEEFPFEPEFKGL